MPPTLPVPCGTFTNVFGEVSPPLPEQDYMNTPRPVWDACSLRSYGKAVFESFVKDVRQRYPSQRVEEELPNAWLLPNPTLTISGFCYWDEEAVLAFGVALTNKMLLKFIDSLI